MFPSPLGAFFFNLVDEQRIKDAAEARFPSPLGAFFFNLCFMSIIGRRVTSFRPLSGLSFSILVLLSIKALLESDVSVPSRGFLFQS